MRKDSFQKIRNVLKKSSNIVIVTHWNPDGDAIGSSLGLYNYLNKKGIKSTVIVPNSYPDFLHWMPGHKQVLNFHEKEHECRKILQSADLLFTLDFNSFKRLDQLGHVLQSLKIPKFLVDHHPQPDDYADYYFHDEKASSTCELIFDLICGLKDKAFIDKKIASSLYTGLMTDTGSFRYPNVNSRTHRIIADLLECDITPAEIHGAVYDNYSPGRIRLIGYSISEKLNIIEGLPVAYMTLTKKELKRFNYQKGDLEGLVNYPFSVKGILVSVLLNESENYVKLSLRSKGKIDVNKFARKYFNGGGHINAAGGKSDQPIEKVEERFVELIKTIF